MKRPLRVLSWRGAWGRALAKAVSQPFSGSTGIDVEAVGHVGLTLPAALGAALDARKPPPVDVVWCNTTAAIHAAARGHCDPLDGLTSLAELVPRARPPASTSWAFVQTYVVVYVLVYNKALYPSEAPRSWNVLFRRSHRGRVVLYPGGKGFFPIAQILGGGALSDIPDRMAPCWAALRRLRDQLGPPDYSVGLGPLLARGEIDLCYRALPNALGFIEEGADVGWVAPAEGVADTTDALWVPRGLDDQTRAWARRYVDYAMRGDVQARWCEALGAVPMHRSAAAPARLGAAGVPTDAQGVTRVLHLPPEIEALHEASWARAFDDAVRSP